MSFHDATVPAFLQILGSLEVLLTKAEAHCRAKNIQPEVLLSARLDPDMSPLTRQIQTASDFAAKTCARLTGNEVPSVPDTEKTFEELQQRIAKTVDYVKAFKPAQFAVQTEITRAPPAAAAARASSTAGGGRVEDRPVGRGRRSSPPREGPRDVLGRRSEPSRRSHRRRPRRAGRRTRRAGLPRPRCGGESVGRRGEVEGEDACRGRGRPRGAWQKSSEHWHSCLWQPAAETGSCPHANQSRSPRVRQTGRPGRGRPLRSDAQRARLGGRAGRQGEGREARRRRLWPGRRQIHRRGRRGGHPARPPAARNRPLLEDEEVLGRLRKDRRDHPRGRPRSAPGRWCSRRRACSRASAHRQLALTSSPCASTAPTRSEGAGSRTAR